MKLFEPTGLILILGIALIIFGPSRLPQLGQSLGKTIKSFREATDGTADKDEAGSE